MSAEAADPPGDPRVAAQSRQRAASGSPMTRLPYFVGKSVGHQIEAGAGADFVQGQEKPRQTRDFQQAG